MIKHRSPSQPQWLPGMPPPRRWVEFHITRAGWPVLLVPTYTLGDPHRMWELLYVCADGHEISLGSFDWRRDALRAADDLIRRGA